MSISITIQPRKVVKVANCRVWAQRMQLNQWKYHSSRIIMITDNYQHNKTTLITYLITQQCCNVN